jgi:hypothetical protein
MGHTVSPFDAGSDVPACIRYAFFDGNQIAWQSLSQREFARNLVPACHPVFVLIGNTRMGVRA